MQTRVRGLGGRLAAYESDRPEQRGQRALRCQSSVLPNTRACTLSGAQASSHVPERAANIARVSPCIMNTSRVVFLITDFQMHLVSPGAGPKTVNDV